MEPALKQRLLGAAVLVALAVTFLPLLVMERAPDSGASRVSLRVPPAPETDGDSRTIDLPLAAPAAAGPVLATPVESPVAAPVDAAAVPAGPATAAGDYAVSFGSYATTADAARVIAALAAARLRAYQEPAALGTRTVHRVRIGPYPTAADAEAARLAAGRVRADVNAKVIVLDAGATPATTAAAPTAAPVATTPLPAPKPAAPPTTSPTPTTVTAATERRAPAASEPAKPASPATPAPAATPPAAASVGFAVQLGAFANADEATHLRDRARAAGFAAFVEQVRTDRGTLSRVRVGPVPDRAAADALRAQVAAKLGVSGLVRPHP